MDDSRIACAGREMANLPGIDVAYGHELAQLWLIAEREEIKKLQEEKNGSSQA